MPRSKAQYEQIKLQTKEKILEKSLLYFARNGFSGTKISDLSKHIGIAQGTMYQYFNSKEDLFLELQNSFNESDTLKKINTLIKQPLYAKQKINLLSKDILKRFKNDSKFSPSIVINTQITLEKTENNSSSKSTYQTVLYKYMEQLIKQGQQEGSVVSGNPMKLADYYWGVVYLYALKQLFTEKFEMIDANDLSRTLLK